MPSPPASSSSLNRMPTPTPRFRARGGEIDTPDWPGTGSKLSGDSPSSPKWPKSLAPRLAWSALSGRLAFGCPRSRLPAAPTDRDRALRARPRAPRELPRARPRALRRRPAALRRSGASRVPQSRESASALTVVNGTPGRAARARAPGAGDRGAGARPRPRPDGRGGRRGRAARPARARARVEAARRQPTRAPGWVGCAFGRGHPGPLVQHQRTHATIRP